MAFNSRTVRAHRARYARKLLGSHTLPRAEYSRISFENFVRPRELGATAAALSVGRVIVAAGALGDLPEPPLALEPEGDADGDASNEHAQKQAILQRRVAQVARQQQLEPAGRAVPPRPPHLLGEGQQHVRHQVAAVALVPQAGGGVAQGVAFSIAGERRALGGARLWRRRRRRWPRRRVGPPAHPGRRRRRRVHALLLGRLAHVAVLEAVAFYVEGHAECLALFVLVELILGDVAPRFVFGLVGVTAEVVPAHA